MLDPGELGYKERSVGAASQYSWNRIENNSDRVASKRVQLAFEGLVIKAKIKQVNCERFVKKKAKGTVNSVILRRKISAGPKSSIAMSEQHFDEYEHFNYDYDKHIFTGHGGKQRSKREATLHTNHNDPSGHSRKILNKLMNSEHNKREVVKAKA